MKLIELNIENFRNLKNLSFEFSTGKQSIIVCGKNGIGKSTIIDSILWLLCDETLVYGCQNDDNLDKNDRSKPVNISARFLKDNGDELVLKRILTPKFTKSGAFSKYENEFEINGAEYSVKQYFTRLKNEEFGIKVENDPEVSSFNTLRSILDIDYLNTIKYQVAREKIEKILKITKNEEFINKPEYSIIKDDLKAQLFDIAKIKSKYNKQKDAIETNINHLNKNYDALKNAYKPLDTVELEKLENQKAQISAMEYENSIEYKSAMQKNNELNEKLKVAEKEFVVAENKYNSLLREYNTLLKSKEQDENKIENLKQKFITVRDSVNKCPKCQYELNGNDIKKKLNEINVEGQALNENVKSYKEKISKYDLNAIEQDYKTAKNNYNSIVKEIQSASDNLRDIITKEDNQSRIFYNEKMMKISEIDSKINELKSQSNVSVLEVKENELKVVRKELGEIETKIEVIKDFEKNKNNIVNNRIKEVFPTLDFRLWEESDTGTITNTCKVYLKNVGYEGINTGHRILVGIEIIKALRNVLGVKESLPIIFDDVSNLDKENFEKIKNETKNQIITTYVSEDNEINIINI